jgi:tRNA nucleotidyltransferase/poly(A) polymerase
MKIVLTESEGKIIGLIRKYAENFDSQITLRVAGGWVRDKLLGIES